MTLPYDLIKHTAPQIGLIVLQSDESLERDMVRLLPKQVELLVSRVPSGSTVTPDSLQSMAQALTGSASLLPRDTTFAAVAYGCTSGTAQIGVDAIAGHIKAGVATEQVTEPVSALIAACAHLHIRKLSMITPYIASVSDKLRDVLGHAGIGVTALRSFNEPRERNVVRIAPAAIRDAGIAIGKETDCEAIFLSCTNLRTLDVIEDIEQATGKPVFSSNQVLGWHLAQLVGLDATNHGPGQLYGRSVKTLPKSNKG